jgi:hypothetical protein
MARKTADATVAEAKGRAHTLVSEAEAKSESLVVEARQKAEAEYATTKGRAIQEVAELESRGEALRGAIAEIEARMDGYRAQLRGVAASLESLVDDPQALGIIEGSDGLGDLVPDASASVASPVADSPITDLGGEAQGSYAAAEPSEDPANEVAAESPSASESTEDVSAEADAGNWTASSGGIQSVAEESLDRPTEAIDRVGDEPGGSIADLQASSDWNADEEALSLDSADVGTRGTDKYLRELESLDDPAEDEAADDAMSAFFDAEQEPERRFGWRR